MTTLAEHIKAAGLTRSKFAEMVGISAPYLSQIIAEERTPSIQVALRIASLTDGKIPVESWLDHRKSPSLGAGGSPACSDESETAASDCKGDAA